MASGLGTRAYGAGLFQAPNSSPASARIAAGSKSPTIASSALRAAVEARVERLHLRRASRARVSASSSSNVGT